MRLKIMALCLALTSFNAFADIDVGAVNALVIQSTIVSRVPASTAPVPSSIATDVETIPFQAGLDPAITALARNYTIVVFYESTCPHCQRFTPILKEFGDRYGFTVYAFTTDNQALPAFPTPLSVNPGILNTFFPAGQVILPASFLVNKATLTTYPINTGEMLMPELLSRMDALATAIKNSSQGDAP